MMSSLRYMWTGDSMSPSTQTICDGSIFSVMLSLSLNILKAGAMQTTGTTKRCGVGRKLSHLLCLGSNSSMQLLVSSSWTRGLHLAIDEAGYTDWVTPPHCMLDKRKDIILTHQQPATGHDSHQQKRIQSTELVSHLLRANPCSTRERTNRGPERHTVQFREGGSEERLKEAPSRMPITRNMQLDE